MRNRSDRRGLVGVARLVPDGSPSAYVGVVSDFAHQGDDAPHGTALLAGDLTEQQFASAPSMTSVDVLLIDDLTDDEEDALAAALNE